MVHAKIEKGCIARSFPTFHRVYASVKCARRISEGSARMYRNVFSFRAATQETVEQRKNETVTRTYRNIYINMDEELKYTL